MVRIVCMSVFAAFAWQAQAADRTWGNTAGGSFDVGANWTGGVVPGLGDNARFTANASYTVTFPTSVMNTNAYFYAPGGTVTLDIGAGNLYHLSGGVMRMENSGGAASVDVASGTMNVNTHIYVGDQATHNGNRLTVRNPGTALRTLVWDINIGMNGSENVLLVTNGATVAATRTIAVGYSYGTNNLVVVSGTNSLLTANTTSILVGRYGDYNRLIVEDGAMVHASNSVLSVGDLVGSDYNSVLVRSGSILTNGGNNSSFIGNVGSYNSLTVEGAALRCYNNLNVGQSGSFNRLEVLDGGNASTRTHVYIGSNASSQSNTVVVAGSNSLLRTYYYDINVGNNGHYNTLLITNGASVASYRNIYVGTAGGASGNQLIVRGSASTLVCDGLNNPSYSGAIGMTGTNNALRLEDGATFLCTNAVEFSIGVNSGSWSNCAFVGSGCLFTNPGSVYVGKNGGSSSLTVSNATCHSGYTFIGYGNSGNALTVQDGATYVARGHYFMGNNAGANSNSFVVTGAGTVLTNTQYDLDVGKAGAHNLMDISDGAEVTIVRNCYVGHAIGASNNTLRIQGGTFRCTQSGEGKVIVSNACTLAVCGSNSVVQVRGLRIDGGSALDIRVKRDGFTPISVIGTATFDGTTKLVVDAVDYAKAGGGTVTLMTYGTKSGEILAENMTLTPAGTTVNQADANRITLRVPGFRGTTISVR